MHGKALGKKDAGRSAKEKDSIEGLVVTRISRLHAVTWNNICLGLLLSLYSPSV